MGMALLFQGHVEFVDGIKWQAHKLMLVLPMYILLLEFFGLLRLWWWFGNLGDQICSRGLCDAVDEDAEQWYLQERNEGESKAEENAFSIMEPLFLLFRCVADSREVGFQLVKLCQ